MCTLRRIGLVLVGVAVCGACTVIPTKSELRGDPDLEWNVSPGRAAGYAFVGLPRDVLDFPFTVFHRLFYFRTEDTSSFFGFRIRKEKGPIAEIMSWGIGSVTVTSIDFFTHSITWEAYGEMVAINAAAILAPLLYPVVGAPLEDVLFRYPHDSISFAMAYKAIPEKDYSYFPNIEIFLKQRRSLEP